MSLSQRDSKPPPARISAPWPDPGAAKPPAECSKLAYDFSDNKPVLESVDNVGPGWSIGKYYKMQVV